MTAAQIVGPVGLLGEALAEASPDLMRSLLQSIINALLSEPDAGQAASDEVGEELVPRCTGPRGGHAYAEDLAVAVVAHPGRQEHDGVDDPSAGSRS